MLTRDNCKCKIYFKCYLCRVFNKKEFKKCSLTSLKYGNLCKYGTVLSLWKWLIRAIVITPLALILNWYTIKGGYKYLWLCAQDEFQTFKKLSAFIITSCIVILCIYVTITLIALINREFREKNGTYFKRR